MQVLHRIMLRGRDGALRADLVETCWSAAIREEGAARGFSHGQSWALPGGGSASTETVREIARARGWSVTEIPDVGRTTHGDRRLRFN